MFYYLCEYYMLLLLLLLDIITLRALLDANFSSNSSRRLAASARHVVRMVGSVRSVGDLLAVGNKGLHSLANPCVRYSRVPY